jgi:hypothetical protein
MEKRRQGVVKDEATFEERNDNYGEIIRIIGLDPEKVSTDSPKNALLRRVTADVTTYP